MPRPHLARPLLLTFGLALGLVVPGLCVASSPLGIYASSGATNPNVTDHPQVQGILIRAGWAELEPAPGVFQFTAVEAQAAAARAAGKNWSLAISATTCPSWLTEEMGAGFFTIIFHEQPRIVPKGWDPVVRQRLRLLANALAGQYGNDPLLQLVYVPQMTANGIEGHFNGVPAQTLEDAGYTENSWVEAVTGTAQDFATAFRDKKLAVEVHEILSTPDPGMRILRQLWQDPDLEQRVGGAVWWLSGRTDYQAALLDSLAVFPGDLYAQLIARSDQPERLLNGDLNTALDQARDLGIRYVEAWEYEFRFHTHDEDFALFNAQSLGLSAAQPVPAPAAPALAAFPNPFNPATTIALDLPRTTRVDLTVHDLRGHLVRTLIQRETLAAGHHDLPWDGTDDTGQALASGVYTLMLRADHQVQIRPLTLLK